MNNLPFLDTMILDNSLGHWLAAIGIAVVIHLAAILFKGVAVRRLLAWAQRTRTHIDDALVSLLQDLRLWLIAAVAVWAGSEMLTLPDKLDTIIQNVAVVAVFVQVGFWGSHLLQFWANRSNARRQIDASVATTASFAALLFVGRVLLWSMILLMTLDNLGVNVNALVTSLGIGGIAVALAVQNVLGDLFASLSIVLDKPFEAGDFIVVDDYAGTVEHVGLKSTRLRSLNGEQIVIGNSDLLKSRLRNYKRMHERRVEFCFRIAYETPIDKLRKVPGIVKGIIESRDRIRFERAHFKELGDEWLSFEVVYWVTDADFNLYMDIQQEINLQLMAAMAKEKIEFASGSLVKVVDRTPRRKDQKPIALGENGRGGEESREPAKESRKLLGEHH
jgi:small-conductance mechanosensitive channel